MHFKYFQWSLKLSGNTAKELSSTEAPYCLVGSPEMSHMISHNHTLIVTLNQAMQGQYWVLGNIASLLMELFVTCSHIS